MDRLEYTEKQLKIINGETPMEEANGRAISWLYKKAVANNDYALAEKAKARLDELKTIDVEKSRQRSLARYHLKHNGLFEWNQPKSNEYTEHQKKVVRGEIPISEVHTRELISIHLKAYNSGDYELSERLLDLINSRKQASKEKKARYNRAKAKYKNFASLRDYDTENGLSKWEQAVLMCIVDLSECSEEQMRHILSVVQEQNNEELIAIATQLLLYKTDPSVLFVVKTHREAIDLLEEMFGQPIRKPDTWFNEQKADV